MPLRDQVVDVFFTGPDQMPPKDLGGTGRLVDLRNADINHFDPANPGKPQFLNLRQRKGLRSLSTSGHKASDGTAASLLWNGPRFLATTGNGAPFTVRRGLPRVYDGDDWTDYATSRVLTNKTTARPIYSAQSVAQAPDKSKIGDVTCRVWTEVTGGANLSSTSITAVVAGFTAANGSWIRTPFVVQAGGSAGNRTMARVVNDGSRFWVFATDHNGGSPKIRIVVYDTNGQSLATGNVDLIWAYEPGYWDVVHKPGGEFIYLARPADDDPDADDHVILSSLIYSSGSISRVDNTINTIHCNGPVAWATNEADNLCYLITTNFDAGDTVRLWAYQIGIGVDNEPTMLHEYNFGITIPTTPDTLIGYTLPSTDMTVSHKNIVVSFGVPAIESSYGAAFDPALRYTKSYQCTWADVTTLLRQTNGVCQVSRAFAVDDDYYAFTYYQSGSGETIQDVVDVEIQGGDFFFGAIEQPIDIQGNGGTTGSPQTFNGVSVTTTQAQSVQSISAPDTVEITTAPAGISIPEGTAVLKWTLTATGLSGGFNTVGSYLNVDGNTDDPVLNTGRWLIVAMGGAGPSSIFYTSRTSTVGGSLVSDVALTDGTVEAISYTFYQLDGYREIYVEPTNTFLPGGTIVVSGNSNPNNNGTKTIAFAPAGASGVWIETGSEGSNTGAYTAVVTPANPNRWGFASMVFDDSYIGTILQFNDTGHPENVGQFPITAVPQAQTLETGGETTLVPTAFFPIDSDGKIVLDAQAPYQFFLQDVTFDYSYIGAVISWSNPVHAANAGLYKITQVLDDHLVITVPIATTGAPVNESIIDPPSFISILKPSSTYPQVQPQWFITPLGAITTAQVGNLELGLAYADWRREGAETTLGAQNPYLLHVSSPTVVPGDGITVDLPFRAVTVTEQSATAIGGQVSTSAIAAAVIGIKEIKLSTVDYGQYTSGLIPGPMASVYDGGRFVEADILLGLEQPTLETQQEATNPALTKLQTYQYVACLEAIDGKGNRIWTAPSPALDVTLTEDNNSITISGRLPIPLDSTGTNQAFNMHFGLSNRPMLVISLYRTCIQNGLQTTAHYKITDDLAPNATTPISSSNDSGFTFPNEFTWTYKDENLDSVVTSAEQLYTDRGNIPRFRPPAFHNGAQGWQERDWLNAYDGAIWFSGAISEGEATWYTPLFRIPAPFEPTAIGNLESFLAGFALDSKWYLPAFKPPLNNGSAFDIPAWRRLPLEGGCTGIVIPVRGGVAYTSNFGGVWYLSRSLNDEWTSQDYIDTLDGKTITAMAVDSKQRLHVMTNTTDWFVFNQIARRWSRWIVPGNVKLATVANGVVYFQDNACVGYYDTSLDHDIINAVETGCPLGFTMASLNFGNVAGVKLVRQFQLRGTWKDDHNVAMSIAYADQNPNATTTTMQLFTPDPDLPYVLDAYPAVEEASNYTLVVDADFTGVATPGDSFELDMVAAQVAIDGRAGVNRSTQQISNASS